MRRLIILLIIALTALAVHSGITEATPDAKAVTEHIVVAAESQAGSDAASKSLTGEVISVDEGARQMTLKYSGWLTSKEVTFAVAEPAVAMLAEIQPGDQVEVGYSEVEDRLVAMTINKLPAERGERG